jgi:hypothetical protein
MIKILVIATCVLMVSEAALAQTTSTEVGKQVNPGTNQSVGRKSSFGMNNGGDATTGQGLHGGTTSDTYNWWVKKEGLTRDRGGKTK